MKITWLNHSCLQVHMAGQVIYFDPYQIPEENSYLKANIVCVSHSHGDHYDATSIHILQKSGTKIICPLSCEEIIQKENAIGLKPYETVDIDGIQVQGVPAYNIERTRFHPKKNDWLGYILDDGEVRVYHAGDTEYIPEMSEFKDIDYALLPVGGNQYTMDFSEGVSAAKAINPKNVVPMHDWDKNLHEFADLMKKEAPKIGVIVLEKNVETEV